jgi:hypothetical protein
MSNFNIELPTFERLKFSLAPIGNHQSQIGNALVEVRGFEPLTPWLQTMCSAN